MVQMVSDKELAFARQEIYRRPWGYQQYAAKYLKIRTKKVGGDIIPFVFNPEQVLIFQAMRRQYLKKGYVRIVILKPRQIGSSTWCVGFGFSYAVQRPNINVVTFAHEDKTALEIFRTVTVFYEELPRALRPAKRGDRQDGMEFQARRGAVTDNLHALDNLRSSYSVMTAGLRQQGQVQGIGRAIHFLHLSEGARYPNPEAVVTGPINAVPDGEDAEGTVILNESTARPEGHWFKAECEQAKAGKSDFQYIFLPWYDMPTYRVPGAVITAYTPEEETLRRHFSLDDAQLEWRRRKIQQLEPMQRVTGVDAEDLFAQDYPADDEECWRIAGQSVFKKAAQRWAEAFVREPDFTGSLIDGQLLRDVGSEQDGYPPLHIWELPDPNCEYVIAADVGEGIPGGDYSVATVWNVRTGHQAAQWRGLIEPALFGYVLAGLGRFYNTAIVAPEINNHGYTAQSILTEIYPACYRQKREEYIAQDPIPDRYGWYSTSRTKPHLVGMGQLYLAQQKVRIHSRRLVQELKNYICIDSKTWGGSAGWHDDCVVSFMIGMVMLHDENRHGGQYEVVSPAAVVAGAAAENPEPWSHDLDSNWWKPARPRYVYHWR